MASMKRFSIALLMTVVLLVAVDIAILKASWNAPAPAGAIAVITLPMVNLLVSCARRARKGQASRSFWLGFEAAGWSMVMLIASCSWMSPGFYLFPLSWLADRNGPITLVELVFFIYFAVVAYTIPQILVATLAGRLVARYRVVIERRQPSSSDHDRVHARPGGDR